MTRSEFPRDAVPSLTVVKRTWLDGYDSDPPTLELALSNGKFLKVGYDIDYSHPLLWLATDAREDFVSCTRDETGLDLDLLEPLLDEVANAAEQHEHERLSDQDDGAECWGDR